MNEVQRILQTPIGAKWYRAGVPSRHICTADDPWTPGKGDDHAVHPDSRCVSEHYDTTADHDADYGPRLAGMAHAGVGVGRLFGPVASVTR